jgi:DNA-binding MarR family transcriptional regulator
MGAFYEWVNSGREAQRGPLLEARGFETYFRSVAEARYVIRKVFRIVDEQAKKAGLEPLEHQALIQVFGSSEPLRMIDVAERLDIAPALGSRLVKRLEQEGLVTRLPSEEDRRMTYVIATDAARDLLGEIDRNVELHVGYFQQQLTDAQRAAALGIFAFYLGAAPDARYLDDLVKTLFGSEAEPSSAKKTRQRSRRNTDAPR